MDWHVRNVLDIRREIGSAKRDVAAKKAELQKASARLHLLKADLSLSLASLDDCVRRLDDTQDVHAAAQAARAQQPKTPAPGFEIVAGYADPNEETPCTTTTR